MPQHNKADCHGQSSAKVTPESRVHIITTKQRAGEKLCLLRAYQCEQFRQLGVYTKAHLQRILMAISALLVTSDSLVGESRSRYTDSAGTVSAFPVRFKMPDLQSKGKFLKP